MTTPLLMGYVINRADATSYRCERGHLPTDPPYGAVVPLLRDDFTEPWDKRRPCEVCGREVPLPPYDRTYSPELGAAIWMGIAELQKELKQ